MLHGKEILIFFNRYGTEGFVGLAVASAIIAAIIHMVLNIIVDKNLNKYEDFIKATLAKNKLIKSIITSIITIFLLISFCIMIAAFIAYFNQELGIKNNLFVAILLGITIYIILLKDINGIIKINEILMPMLIILVIILGIKSGMKISNTELIETPSVTKNWIISAIIYASYNSIVLIPILLTLKSLIKNKKEIKIISITCGVIFFILACVIYFLISKQINIVKEIEMPIVYIANMQGNIYKYIYGGVILRRNFNNSNIGRIWIFEKHY